MKQRRIIAAYCRSSRIKEDSKLYGIESQKSMIKNAFKDSMNPIHFYIDKNISGKKSNRPALNRLKYDLSTGIIESIVVSDISRIARSLKNLLELEEFIRKNDASFISLKESFNTSDSTGKLLFQIMGAVGEFGSSISRERSLAVVEECRKKNVKLGAPRKEIKEEKLNEIKRLRFEENIPYRDIAKKVNIPITTVHRTLKRLKHEG